MGLEVEAEVAACAGCGGEVEVGEGDLFACRHGAAADGEGAESLEDVAAGVGGELVGGAVRAGPGVGGGAAVGAREFGGVDADLAGAGAEGKVGQADGGVGRAAGCAGDVDRQGVADGLVAVERGGDLGGLGLLGGVGVDEAEGDAVLAGRDGDGECAVDGGEVGAQVAVVAGALYVDCFSLGDGLGSGGVDGDELFVARSIDAGIGGDSTTVE